MRFCLVILLFISVVCIDSTSEAARRGAGEDYWKKIMKDEQMPKALTDLFQYNQEEEADISSRAADVRRQKKRFLTDFDTNPNLVIYQNNAVIH